MIKEIKVLSMIINAFFAKLLIVVSLFIHTCGIKKKEQNINNSIIGLLIYRNLPVLDTNGNVTDYRPYETKMFFYNNQVLIQSNYYHATIINPNENTIPVYNIYWRSFVYSRDKPFGLLLDSSNLKTARVAKKDSMLNKEWAINLNFNKLFVENNYSLNSKIPKNEKQIEEEYAIRNKKDTTMTGVLKLIFSKDEFKGIDYSLSKEIDSVKEMKLIEVRIINDERYLPNKKMHIDRAEILYSIKKNDSFDTITLKKLFDQERGYIYN